MIRPTAVAGSFYPGDPHTLAGMVDALLDGATEAPLEGRLVALICPHAGYVYSGPVAASGYRRLRGLSYRRVVLLAPSHHVAFRGLALPDCTAFSTPLGEIPLWGGCRELARQRPFLLDSRPHKLEHAAEVQLPFLQRTLEHFELVPIVFGSSEDLISASALLPLVNDETLFVVSTDLSHYLPYAEAQRVDRATVDLFLSQDARRAATAEACGRGPTATLLDLSNQSNWKIQLLDYRNSGDTAGDKSRVVGYAAFALTSAATQAGPSSSSDEPSASRRALES